MYALCVCPQIICSECRNNDGDDGESDSDRVDTDAESDHSSTHGNKRRRGINKTKKTRNQLLIKPRTQEQAEKMSKLLREARAMEQKRDKSRVSETRNLTLQHLIDAANCLKDEEDIPEAICRRLEKDDYGLYGITVRQAGESGETTLGTTVTSREGRKGEVVEAKMEKGYHVFTIKWKDGKGDARSAYTTLDVLKYRDDGQGVVELRAAHECMKVFLLATLCMVYTQVYRFIDDDTKVENLKYLSRLPNGQKRDNILRGRKHAWEKMSSKSVGAMAMLMEKEKEFLNSDEDEGLYKDMEKSSCFKMMALDDYDETDGRTSLVKSENEDFHPKSLPFVNHFVRGAQASFRVGRPTNFAASTIHLSMNELPPGVNLTTVEEKRSCFYKPGKKMRKYSLGMRCVLARARVARKTGKSSTCQFAMRFPLYRLLDLSRADGLALKATTEHSSKVAPTLRHADAYEQALSMNKKVDKDMIVLRSIKRAYLRVSREKRNEKSDLEDENEKIAFGVKWANGRTHLVGSEKCRDGYLLLEDLVSHNGIDSFMDRLPNKDEVVKMCNDVLEMNPGKIGKHKNEDHFYPKEFRDRIDGVVDHLRAHEITRSDISLFSCALTVMDSVLTAALRKQDTLGQLARDLHRLKCKDVHGKDIAVTRCLLPKEFKNKKSLQNSTCGVVVNHTKDEKCAGAYAVMAVIGRRVMRRLLDDEANGSGLADNLGPFDENGKVFTPGAITRLYKYLGQRCMGLSHFGHHIIRSNHATAVAMYCVRKGLSVEDQAVKDLFALARHGENQRLRFYTHVKADTPNSCKFLTDFAGIKHSLGQIDEDCAEGQAYGKKIGNLGDVAGVGLSGIFAFEDFDVDNPGKSKTYAAGNGGSRGSVVVQRDPDEEALAKKVRMAIMASELEKVQGNVVKSGSGGKKGVLGAKLEFRESAFRKVNGLVLAASKKTLGELLAASKKNNPKVGRQTLAYSLKNDQKTIRVAFHKQVKSCLYSQNPGEKEFLDEFYLELKDSSGSKPGSRAENYRNDHGMEWTYHDWGSDNVCTAVTRRKEGKGGGKKKKLCDEGRGESGKK